MSAPLALITRFFQLVSQRSFAEAGRVLERLKTRMKKTERNRGYIQALNGIILIQRSSDERYAFLRNLDLDNVKELKRQRGEFLKNAKSSFHADYDRGFFSAWADFIYVILKTRMAGQVGNVEYKGEPKRRSK